MRLGFRGKLFVASLALFAIAGLVSLGYLELRLRATLVENETVALVRQAGSYRAVLEQSGLQGEEGIRRADALAKALAEAEPVRLSLIDGEGRVLADSSVPRPELASLEDHRQRPEVRAALEGERGLSQRYSTTVQTGMLYVALPYDAGGQRFAVRASMPLSAVDAVVADLRGALALAGALGIVAALVMSAFASSLASRTLRTVVEGARRLAEGTSKRPIELSSGDELQHIAGSVNRLAAELSETVQELAEERDRARAILASMREGVLALDEERRVTLANPAALELLGLDEAPLGRPLIELVRAPEALEVAERTAEEPIAEAELELALTPPRRVLLRATKREGEGVVLVLHDVSEMRRLEAVRSELVANVSHELRTPVAVLRANAEALQSGALEDPEHAHRFVDALHRNAERLSHLVADLLDLARLERAEYRAELEDVPLAAACRSALESLERAREQRAQRLHLAIDEALVVRADRRGLEQVVVNLVENAINYGREGGSVEVRAKRRGERVLLEVADDGPGIPAAHRERIFQRFYRVDAGRSRDMGGTGLGLSIVKHHVLSMGGEVGVRDNQPQGSVFFVELPAA